MSSTSANFYKHIARQKHKDNLAKKSAASGSGSLALAFARQSAAAPSYAATAEQIRSVIVLNALRFMPRSRVGSVITPETVALAGELFKVQGTSALSQGNMSRAVLRGGEMLREAMRAKLEGTVGSLVVDEANSDFGGRQKVLGIVYASPQIGRPVLLKIIVHVKDDFELDEEDEEGNKPSALAARAVRTVLEEMGVNLETQVTAFIADGALINDAIAKLLGLVRLHCVSHALQLAFSKVTPHFKRFRDATLGLSAFLSAGGGTQRASALREEGITTSKLHCVSTRWRQPAETADYLLEAMGDSIVLEKVRAIMIKSPERFQVGKVDDEEEGGAGGAAAGQAEPDVVVMALEGQGMQFKTPLKSLAKRIKEVYELQAARRSFRTELELRIVKHLTGDLLVSHIIARSVCAHARRAYLTPRRSTPSVGAHALRGGQRQPRARLRHARQSSSHRSRAGEHAGHAGRAH